MAVRTLDIDSEARRFLERANAATRAVAEPVLSFLSAGFRITWLKEESSRIWAALLKPGDAVRRQFGLTSEYFLVGNGHDEDIFRRTLLMEPPQEVRGRVDPQIRFVASPERNLKDSSASWAMQNRAAVVP